MGNHGDMFKKVSSVADDGTRADRGMSPQTAWFIVVMFLVGGILVSTYALRIDWILHQSKFWTKSDGRVVSVKRIGHDRGLTYTYQYVANGKTETSTNVEPGLDSQYYPLSESQRIMVCHTAGDDPYAFLLRPDAKSMALPHIIGFCWTIMGGIGVLALSRRPVARAKHPPLA